MTKFIVRVTYTNTETYEVDAPTAGDAATIWRTRGEKISDSGMQMTEMLVHKE